jgi:hypothetical protein
MNARIANFEPMWNAVVRLPIPPPAPLMRCDNRHHLLSDADLERWLNSNSSVERARIVHENDERLDAEEQRRATGFYAQEELDINLLGYVEEELVPAPLTAPLLGPLDYYDPDADDIYDLEFANY